MDKIDSMRAFKRVVEAGGFAAAAREMGLTRSSVNKHVLRLEQMLKTQLLQRSTRKVIPTDAGYAFYERCTQILEDYDDAVSEMLEQTDRPQGRLRINAPMSFGIDHLTPVVNEYQRLYPDVQVELMLNDRLVDPIEEGFDLTLRSSQPRPTTSLVSRSIAPIERVLAASPKYVEECGEPKTPEALIEHRCLQYGHQELVSNSWDLIGSEGEFSVRINCVMWSNNGDVLRDSAIAGEGIVLLPTFIVGDAVKQGVLKQVLTQYRPTSVDLFVMYPRHRHLSTKVRLMVELIEKQFEAPYWDRGIQL